MEIVEIRKQKPVELEESIAAEKARLRKIRASHALSPLENPMKIRKARRLVARMKTVLRELDFGKELTEKKVQAKEEPVPNMTEGSSEKEQKKINKA